jgi:TRAP-type C4-dicarboxylate transport system permease small subunit
MRPSDFGPVSPIAAIKDAGACSPVFDKVFRLAVEIPAALLVAAEIVILLAGVISRFVFDRPLIWSDELASILFLWLALLGSVIALRRGEHLRMAALVGRASLRSRALLDVLAISLPLVFLFVIATVGGQYAIGELPITTPALNISNSWRTVALPVGFALMIAVCVLRLWQLSRPRLIASAILLTAVMIAVLMSMRPVFMGLGDVNLIIFFVGIMGATIFVGVPIAFAFGLAAIGYLFLSTSTPLEVVVGRLDEGISHPILLSVPLFVFLGVLTEMTGMARAIVAFLASLLGHIRGGLSYVLVGAMYLVSGISGSKAADMAVLAPVLFPEMKARGASGGELVALLSASGAQTETVPPSLVLITIGSVTGV